MSRLTNAMAAVTGSSLSILRPESRGKKQGALPVLIAALFKRRVLQCLLDMSQLEMELVLRDGLLDAPTPNLNCGVQMFQYMDVRVCHEGCKQPCRSCWCLCRESIEGPDSVDCVSLPASLSGRCPWPLLIFGMSRQIGQVKMPSPRSRSIQ